MASTFFQNLEMHQAKNLIFLVIIDKKKEFFSRSMSLLFTTYSLSVVGKQGKTIPRFRIETASRIQFCAVYLRLYGQVNKCIWWMPRR